MVDLRIHQIRTLHEMDAIEDLWRDLESRDNRLSVFQSWDWNRAWCEYVLKNSNGQLAVRIIENSAGQQVAILPFYEVPLVGSLISVTQFLGHRMSFHNDILLAEPGNISQIEGIIELMLDDLGSRNFLHLRHMVEQSVLTKVLLQTGRAIEQCNRIYVRTESSITEQHKRLGRSAGKTYRWARNKLQKEFKSKYVHFSGSLFEKAFNELIVLHNMRFDSQGKASLLAGDNLEFVKYASNKLSQENHCEILQLRASDEKIIAAMLLIIDGDHCFFVQCGFDTSFSRYSPLRVLIAEAMRYAFDELNCTIFDFGPGYESYKYDWSPELHKNYFCSLGGNGWYSKLVAKSHQMAFERHLTKSKTS